MCEKYSITTIIYSLSHYTTIYDHNSRLYCSANFSCLGEKCVASEAVTVIGTVVNLIYILLYVELHHLKHTVCE